MTKGTDLLELIKEQAQSVDLDRMIRTVVEQAS